MKIPFNRRGFTVVEIVAALAILAVVMTVVAQLGYFSLKQRQLTEAKQAALEVAHNVLERARTLPFAELTPEWAAKQSLPKESDDFLIRGKLEVKVQNEKSVRRVTVKVSWQNDEQVREVELVTLLGAREKTP